MQKPPAESDWDPVVYSEQEVAAIQHFHEVLGRVSDRTPKALPFNRKTQRLPEWIELRDTAQESLDVFNEHGRLSEEVEVAAGQRSHQ